MCVSAAYIVVEWRYNLRLMQLVSDPDLSRDAMEQFSTTGRIVGAFGLAWGLLRPFVSAFRGTILQLALFAAIWLCMFFGITAVFKIVIDHVEPERKRAMMALFQARGEMLNGRSIGAALPVPASDAIVGPVMMVDIGMLTHDPEIVHAAIEAMEDRARRRTDELLETAERNWVGYRRLHRAIDRLHRRHRDATREYLAAPDRGRAKEAFRERTGGMEPIPDLSRAEFVRSQLPMSSMRDAQEIVRALDEVVLNAPGRPPLRVRDVPHGMDRRAYDRWVADRVDELAFMLAPPAARINEHPHANAIVAAVCLPPIAMCLSLLAVLVNLAALLAQILTSMVAVLSNRWWKPVALAAGTLLPALAVVGAAISAGPAAYDAYPRAMEAQGRMVAEMGVVGRLWARAGAVQCTVNRHAGAPEAYFIRLVDHASRHILPPLPPEGEAESAIAGVSTD